MSLHVAITGEAIPDKVYEESRTRQSEMRSADINLIMAKYQKTGVLPPATRQGFFADVSEVGDYREALDRIQRMDNYFLHLDPEVRKQFDNDPAIFLDFVSHDANLPKLEEMGLIAPDDSAVPAKDHPLDLPARKPPPIGEVKPEPVPPEPPAEPPPVVPPSE